MAVESRDAKIQQNVHLDPIDKRENDNKEYRAIRLPNGLEALLISNENLTSCSQEKKAECSLCVNVGNFSDPPEFPGISYFLRYILFQDLKKSPEQCTLNKYIKNHNGNNYVSVDNEHTIFYFYIEENSLFVALKRFGDFFVEPIISKQILIEQHNVQNEFQKSLRKRKKKYDQLFSSFAQTGHPASKFSADHLTKLHDHIDYDKLYNVLAKFKNRHYSAHRMKLAIQSGLSLDVMEKFVTSCFANVSNNGIPPDNFSEFKNDLPFDTPAFRKMYKVKEYLGLFTRLKITWVLPSFPDFYKCNSYLYIPWVFEYKGKGSLISYLHHKLWSPISTDKVDCEIQQNSLYCSIQLTIELTSEGLNRLEDILDAIFSFINLLKRAGPQKEIYNDMYESKKNIRFISYDIGSNFLKDLSKNMHFYPSKTYIIENKLDSNYNAKVIQKCLNYLTPEVTNIMTFCIDYNDFEIKKIEPWWQTAYTDIEIPKEWIERWKVIEPLPGFFLPSPNIFFTKNLLLMPISKEPIPKYPIKIYCNSVSEIWYCPKYHLSKCYMHFYFISPLKLESLKNGVLMDIYCGLWKQILAEELYPASLAGFKYAIKILNNGFTLKISGLNETLPNITLKDFQDFVKSFTEYLYIQCLVQGNMTSTAVIKTVQQIIKTINCNPLPDTIKQLRGTQIPLGTSYYKIKNIIKDTSSLVTNYYQTGVSTIELSTLIRLISCIMDHKLRKDQSFDKFMYTNVDFKNVNGILGYSITVCTYYQYTIEFADKKIDRFLREFKNDMEKLTKVELDTYKEMFLYILQGDANLEKEVERNWNEIITCTYMFDLHEQEILALEKINVNKLREWLADHTLNENNFRKLSLQVVGTIPKKLKYVDLTNLNDDYQYNPNRYHYITKIEDFKKKLFIFPTNPLRAQAIRLPNGLEALLISDEYLTTSFSQEKKAACSLFIDAGNFSDTPEFPGVSYSLAYMFSQESEKYLEQSDTTMKDFIEDHNGTLYINVSPEHTIFYFDVEQENFHVALYNFGDFLEYPIMSKHVFIEKQDVIRNGIKIVILILLSQLAVLTCHSYIEFQRLFGKSRYEQLFSSFAQTGHPANKFSVDHLIKLRNNIDYDKLYNELDKFKNRHYSAHRMKLVIRSRFQLNIMEEFVKACFANIPNNRMPPDNFFKFKKDLPFDTPAFRKMYKIKHDEEHMIQLTWALPSFSDFYNCNSYQYILRIIRYKGEGSLISYLRQKMWSSLDNIFNCKSQQNTLYGLMQLTIALTSEGLKHLEDVLDAIFSFINLLKKAGLQKEIYNNIYECEQNNFRFTNYDNESICFIKQLCENMHFYPPNAYITGKLDFNYNAKVIKKYLNYLTPEMANIMIFSKDFNDFELKKIEPWWQTAYTNIEIPKQWIKRWKVIEPLSEFFLPSPNTFLTKNLCLMQIPNEQIEKYPIKLYCNSVSEIWYHRDPKFRLPKCCIHFYFISPLNYQSLMNEVLKRMYCELLKQLLTEKLYPAELTGFKYEIKFLQNNFTLKISGPTETLPFVADTIAQGMVNCTSFITEDIFENIKIQQIQTFYHYVSEPKSFITDMALSILKLDHHSQIDMYNTVQNITLKDFRDFVKSFTEHLYIQCCVQENMTPSAAVNTVQQFIKTINCSPFHPNTMQQFRSIQIPLGISYYKIKNINKLDKTSVIKNYYQAGVNTIELSTLIHLINCIMNDKLGEVLADKFEHATVNVVNYYGILGYSITVCTQAHKYRTEYVDKMIEEFLRLFKNDLEKLTDEELDVYKGMFLNSKSHNDVNIEDEENWYQILHHTYIFHLHEQEIHALKDINVKKLCEWFADHTSNGSNFRKLSLHIVGTIPKKAKYVNLEYINDDHQQYKLNKYHYITKVEDYKKKLFIFPTDHCNKSFQSTE
ncbi:NRDC protein, partial [Pseudoatta argentina]